MTGWLGGLEPLEAVAIVAASYLLGAVPFGLIFTRLAGLGDIRAIGSGNIGATNVLRTGRRGLALATLLADAGKGLVAVLAGWAYGGESAAVLAGLAAFLGHLFPVYLRFRGGKGVATYIGVIAGLFWPGAVLFCGVWLAVAALTRYSSLSALVAALATPVALWFAAGPAYGVVASLMSALLYLRHARNISNLLSGHESKIGQRAGPQR